MGQKKLGRPTDSPNFFLVTEPHTLTRLLTLYLDHTAGHS